MKQRGFFDLIALIVIGVILLVVFNVDSAKIKEIFNLLLELIKTIFNFILALIEKISSLFSN